jgi:alkaline phosphatase D
MNLSCRLFFLSLGLGPAALFAASIYQGNGIKIGEVTANSAVIWTRLTTAPDANWNGIPFLPPSIDGNRAGLKRATEVARQSGMSAASAKAEQAAAQPGLVVSQADLREIVLKADWRSQIAPGRTLADMHGALPGAAGSLRVVLTPSSGGTPIELPWAAVEPQRDHTRQFTVASLQPGTAYRVRVESKDEKGMAGEAVEGAFRTALAATSAAPVKFAVVTCGDYPRRDDPVNGHRIYDTMSRLSLDFMVHTGDVEYYDKPDPWATSAELARFKWNRLFALPFQRRFHNVTPVYYTYDDHDILKNDAWPGQTYGALTWEEGVSIFAEQTPRSPLPYRTFRHGKDVQIWVVEGRQYRSANTNPDGPAKTILGAEQKAWLFRTITASDATFKILLSPTPIVGPDRGRKNDNHANTGFKHEGDELRRFLGGQRNLVVACGDRHWQYFSTDPVTGTREYGCGPSSDVHAGGYQPQPGDEAVQKFFRLQGGFLTFTTEAGTRGPVLIARHHAVDGVIVHETALDSNGGLTLRPVSK